MIRVLHVTEDHSSRNTGVSGAIDILTRCMPETIRPAIACVGQETIPLRPGVDLLSLPTGGIANIWRFSPGGEQRLANAIAESDIVHLHGVWMWIQWAAARLAVRLKKPFILTAHGMLEPWMWQRQAWPQRLKKFLYWNMFAYPAFCRANRVHALTPREANTINSSFPGQQSLIIPHCIDLQSADKILAQLPPVNSDLPPYFLYMGRLHPGKAIHLLIRAFSRLPEKRFVLKIAGPIQTREQAYADSLFALVTELGLEQRVIFTGAVQGTVKWQLYRDAWAFCLPSFTEAIGLVNLEAAAAGTPVITTYETGVIEEWDQSGGIRIHPTEESIYVGLKQAIRWTPDEQHERGKALRGLVEKYYGWDQIGQTWAAAYQSLR
jgi:glycosyltransferase involved in cell wall biosynthesis